MFPSVDRLLGAVRLGTRHSKGYSRITSMLKREDNELLTRVGPGTPMGELFRRFWLPALLPEELRIQTALPCDCVCSART